MKLHRTTLLSLAILALATLACTDTPTSASPEAPSFGVTAVGHLVTGSGHVETPSGLREFTFHAVEHPDGSVRGSYKVVLPNGLFFEADVTCVSVAGTTGWVGGVIRDTNAGVLVVGSTSMFYAIDSGEGGEDTDVVSIAAFNAGEGVYLEFCAEQPLEPVVVFSTAYDEHAIRAFEVRRRLPAEAVRRRAVRRGVVPSTPRHRQRAPGSRPGAVATPARRGRPRGGP